jgi:hypothetical protein
MCQPQKPYLGPFSPILLHNFQIVDSYPRADRLPTQGFMLEIRAGAARMQVPNVESGHAQPTVCTTSIAALHCLDA